MKYSISLPAPSGEQPVSIDDLTRIARAVEEAGFEACATTDHPFPVVTSAAGHQALDPFVVLSYLAAATERVRLHFNLIVMPYRNPFMAARMLATLDVVSRGRVIAAIGTGYMEKEFEALGADFAARGAATEAGVEAMRAAWTGEPVEREGAGYRATGNVMLPRPLTPGGPALWRGGNARRAMDHAVRACDGWSPFEVTATKSRHTATAELGLEHIAARISALRDLEEQAGRTTPLEVAFVRPRADWLDAPDRAEQLQLLEDAGVDWLVLRPRGTTAEQIVEGIADLRQLAGRSS